MSGDNMTVLHSPWLRLAKRLRPDGGADGYDRAKTLDAYTVPIADLAAVLALLHRLLLRPGCCVVRGELIDATRTKGIRRLLHTCQETGELPTFQDVPRRWLALDMDGLPLPADVPASDLAGCAAVAIATLPGTCQGAACIVQASARHGTMPGARLRLWFWLSRPTWGHELKRWFADTPTDRSVLAAVQPIYTAGPVLAPGVADPVPVRLLALPGRPVVAVPAPELLAPPQPVTPARAAAIVTEGRCNAYVRSALVQAAHRIGTAAEGGRHPLIVAETSRLARFVEPGYLTRAEIGAVVVAAAQQAGKDDLRELHSAIVWGLDNPWTAGPLPGSARHG